MVCTVAATTLAVNPTTRRNPSGTLVAAANKANADTPRMLPANSKGAAATRHSASLTASTNASSSTGVSSRRIARKAWRRRDPCRPMPRRGADSGPPNFKNATEKQTSPAPMSANPTAIRTRPARISDTIPRARPSIAKQPSVMPAHRRHDPGPPTIASLPHRQAPRLANRVERLICVRETRPPVGRRCGVFS